MAADHAHHLGWDEWERSGADSPLAKVYGILDDAVGALAGALGGDIMLVSDHGAGPLARRRQPQRLARRAGPARSTRAQPS